MRTCLVLVLFFLSLGLRAQENEDFMVIGKKTFSLADFKQEYERYSSRVSYSKESVNHYLREFKVLQAKIIRSWELRLDTASRVVSSLSEYANGVVSRQMEEKNIEGDGAILVGHIFLPLRQHSTRAEEDNLRKKIESARSMVESGDDFMAVADNLVPDGRNIHFMSRNETLAEVENVAFSLEEGQMSGCFLAIDGFHLIKRMPKQATRYVIKEKVTMIDVPSQQELQRIRQELMLEELVRKNVYLESPQTDMAKSRYFQAHQKDYQWSLPHFKGVVYHCKDKETRKRVDAILKKFPIGQWQRVIDGQRFDALRDKVIFERIGLYAKGDNAYLDMQRFSGPKIRSKEGYPYWGSCGHLLKKYPESYMDVSEEVSLDYQRNKLAEWENSLLDSYPIFVSERMLRQLYE